MSVSERVCERERESERSDRAITARERDAGRPATRRARQPRVLPFPVISGCARLRSANRTGASNVRVNAYVRRKPLCTVVVDSLHYKARTQTNVRHTRAYHIARKY